MDLRFSAAEQAFRAEARTWLEANVPTESLGSGDAAIPATAQYVVDYDATSCPNSIGFRFISPASVSEADKALVIPAPGAVYRANYPVPAAP